MPDSIPMILVSSHFQKIKPISNFNSEKLFLMVDLDRCIHCGVCGIGCAMEKEENYPRTIFFTKKHPKQNTVTAPIHLPCSCRYCLTPCTYYDFYNFWVICPEESLKHVESQPAESCDQCLTRLKRGFWPSCATRCSMKAIYFGTLNDLQNAIREKNWRGFGELIL